MQARGALVIPNHGFVGVTSLTLPPRLAAQRLAPPSAPMLAPFGIFAMPERPRRRAGLESDVGRDRVVLAAGSWSSMITVQDADQIPVKPIRGQLIQLQTDPGVIHRVIWGPDGYLVPWPDGSVLVGSTVEDVGFDERHTDEAVAKLRAGGGRARSEPCERADERRAHGSSAEGSG
jgi:hypothetical protein